MTSLTRITLSIAILILAGMAALDCDAHQRQTAVIQANTAQIANAVTCHASASNVERIAAAIDASQLYPVRRK